MEKEQERGRRMRRGAIEGRKSGECKGECRKISEKEVRKKIVVDDQRRRCKH
jgi:hypothetical protein